jgi:hypothetical protein
MNGALADEDRTTAIGLARYAYDYISAAILVERHDPNPGHLSPIPAYFLAVHGIELTLKAFLRHEGVSSRDLRNDFGHDLHACHRKAKELGLKMIFTERPSDTQAMQLLVRLNKRHGLRYIETGFKRLPMWSIVEPLAVGLHQAVSPHVGFKSFSKTYAGCE